MRLMRYCLMIKPNTNSNSTNNYRYGFNGEEKLDEMVGVTGSHLDFGARIYDSRLGRWLSVDPLQADYPSASPYNFALNTPIQAYDPDGRLVIFVNGYNGSKALARDYFDFTTFFRMLGRVFKTEEIWSTDKNDYWGSLDNGMMDRIGDHNVVYADASSHALSTADYRASRGKEAGEALLKKIEAGEVIVKAGETIKIVSHSQGSAYAAAMSKVLTDAKYKVEVEYNFAPKQPEDISITKAMRKVQYSSKKDRIAKQSKMKGTVEQSPFPGADDGAIDGHLIKNYEKVLDIPKGKKGYVAPRKDKPVSN